MSQDFKLILDRTKGYKTDDGRSFVNGLASSTNPGLTGEWLSPEVIRALTRSIEQGLAEIRGGGRDGRYRRLPAAD